MDQPVNVMINGVAIDQSPPGPGPVTREDLNRRVDDIVSVARTFTATLSHMAVNFHGAYDNHVDEMQRVTDDMAQRIVDLTQRNTELINASEDVNANLKRAQDEVNGLMETVAQLNVQKQEAEVNVAESATKYRRINENVGCLLITARRLIANVTPLQEIQGQREAALRILTGITERLEGLQKFLEDPISNRVTDIPPVPPPLPWSHPPPSQPKAQPVAVTAPAHEVAALS